MVARSDTAIRIDAVWLASGRATCVPASMHSARVVHSFAARAQPYHVHVLAYLCADRIKVLVYSKEVWLCTRWPQAGGVACPRRPRTRSCLRPARSSGYWQISRSGGDEGAGTGDQGHLRPPARVTRAFPSANVRLMAHARAGHDEASARSRAAWRNGDNLAPRVRSIRARAQGLRLAQITIAALNFELAWLKR